MHILLAFLRRLQPLNAYFSYALWTAIVEKMANVIPHIKEEMNHIHVSSSFSGYYCQCQTYLGRNADEKDYWINPFHATGLFKETDSIKWVNILFIPILPLLYPFLCDSFYTPWKHQKTRDCIVLPGERQKEPSSMKWVKSWWRMRQRYSTK